jgi:hypothetical protein
MGEDSPRGAILFTLAMGILVLSALYIVFDRPAWLPGGRAAATPMPTATPVPTPPVADTLHSRLVSQSANPTIDVGATTTVTLTFTNTGRATWVKGTPSEVRLGVKDDDKSFSDLGMAVDWLSPARPAVQEEASVAPGRNANFRFQVKGTRAGVHRIPVRLLCEGIVWLEDEGIRILVTVR